MTEAIDFTSKVGLIYVLNIIRIYGPRVLLWISIPCTGGCTWQAINRTRNAKARQRIDMHLDLYRALWKNVEVALEAAQAVSARIAIGWPTRCTYWKRQEVRRALRRHHLLKQDFHGCMFGVTGTTTATRTRPILKPWTVATNCGELRMRLNRQCPTFHSKGCHPDGRIHAICQGADTRATQSYPDEMVEVVHLAHAQDIADRVHSFAAAHSPR